MAIRYRQTAIRQVLRALIIIGIGAGLTYLVQFAQLAFVMVRVLSDINTTTDSATNHRGDEVMASTEASGRGQDSDKTVIRLRRAHHWFWATLVETESLGVHESLKWTNDDVLDITLGFGCLTQMTRQVEKVGSIRIYYHFSYGDTTLARGCAG